MKKYVLSFCLIISVLAAHAQQATGAILAKMDEVVYLKNGQTKRGIIIEFVPGISIKIATRDSLYEYKLADVVKITRELPPAPPPAPPVPDYDFRNQQYVGIIEVGMIDYPKSSENLPRFSINIVNGYQFNPYISLGLGVGADISKDKVYDIPLTADVRVYMVRRKSAPFLSLGLGYNQRIQQDQHISSNNNASGIVFNPAIGGRFAISKKAAISLSAGYKLLGMHYAYDLRFFELDHGITFRLGVHF